MKLLAALEAWACARFDNRRITGRVSVLSPLECAQ